VGAGALSPTVARASVAFGCLQLAPANGIRFAGGEIPGPRNESLSAGRETRDRQSKTHCASWETAFPGTRFVATAGRLRRLISKLIAPVGRLRRLVPKLNAPAERLPTLVPKLIAPVGRLPTRVPKLNAPVGRLPHHDRKLNAPALSLLFLNQKLPAAAQSLRSGD
jgi:hypothetical protein